MRVLHILKRSDDLYPLEFIRRQTVSSSVIVVLIQDAVEMELTIPDASVLVLSDEGWDQERASNNAHPKIGYKEMLDTIFSSDTIVSW